MTEMNISLELMPDAQETTLASVSYTHLKVANGFDEARELIRVEASLQDEAGNTLVSKSQLAGPTISLFQLQVLSEAELEQGLSNKLDILTNNTNIPPGGTVPFMVVFYSAPEQASRFNVTVVEAGKPQIEKK